MRQDLEQRGQGRGRTPAPVIIGLLVALGLLAALPVALLVARRGPPVRPPSTTVVPPKPAAAATPPPDSEKAGGGAGTAKATETGKETKTAKAAGTDETAGPLTISLTATNTGRHVRVGTGVTFTAFTPLPPGRSATLTLFYRLDRGRKTVFSFAQGTLCSTTWVAAAPGRYQFTAVALGDRRQTAASRSVEIRVDPPPPPRVAAAPPPPKAAPAARPSEPKTPRPPVYHVVAAHFAFPRNAAVLADALRRNGYHTSVQRMADSQGKTVYVVETGTYRKPAEVFAAVAGLLRSGYPAYFFTAR